MKEGKKRNVPLDPEEEDTHSDDEETLVAKLRKCLCERRSKLRSRRRTGGSSSGKEIEALRY